MSQPVKDPNEALNASAGAIFVVAFIITMVIVVTGSNNFHSNNPPANPLAVARIESTDVVTPPTETLAPIFTPIPPTATIAPTNTPIPPTATSVPTTTPIPPTQPPSPTDVPAPTEQPTTETSTTSAYSPELIARGQELFTTCGACHGANGQGIANLGKSLVGTDFIRTQTDDQLVQFITGGRPIWDAANTTGVDMPPKGGNPTLTGEDIGAIVAYIRSLDTEAGTTNTSAEQPTEAVVVEAPTEQPTTETSTTSAYSPELIARGQELFTTCGACHGANGQGIANLGKSLVGTDFIRTQTDDQLVQFITGGRPIWDAANTTGVDMPPKGGNPTLTGEDIGAIVAYIRSLDTGG